MLNFVYSFLLLPREQPNWLIWLATRALYILNPVHARSEMSVFSKYGQFHFLQAARIYEDLETYFTNMALDYFGNPDL